jgi:hypothetical protein
VSSNLSAVLLLHLTINLRRQPNSRCCLDVHRSGGRHYSGVSSKPEASIQSRPPSILVSDRIAVQGREFQKIPRAVGCHHSLRLCDADSVQSSHWMHQSIVFRVPVFVIFRLFIAEKPYSPFVHFPSLHWYILFQLSCTNYTDWLFDKYSWISNTIHIKTKESPPSPRVAVQSDAEQAGRRILRHADTSSVYKPNSVLYLTTYPRTLRYTLNMNKLC